MAETKVLTNEALKKAVPEALTWKGICTDMDSCVTAGYYGVTAEITEGFSIPNCWKYGILTVKVASSLNYITQEYIPHNSRLTSTLVTVTTDFAIRFYVNGDWGPWRRFEGVL